MLDADKQIVEWQVVQKKPAAKSNEQTSAGSSPPTKIFCDTDMETDCDDAGALAVLHALADAEECEILATVCSVRDPLAAGTVAAINHYYGRPNLPLGLVKGDGVLIKSKFAGPVAAEFPHRWKSAAGKFDADAIPDAVEVYREVLERQPDSSVVVVTLGYLTNLKNLLQVPGSDKRPSGRDLIKKKVARLICLGGNFVGNPPADDLKLGNVNFQRDPGSALYTIQHWPVPIVFVGREIGSVPSGLELGESLARTPKLNPVRRAYEHYFGGLAKNRHVADLTAVLYAVRGERDYWDIETRGYMELQPDMKFEWKGSEVRNQAYLLKKRHDGRPNDDYIEGVLEPLLTHAPRGPAKQ